MVQALNNGNTLPLKVNNSHIQKAVDYVYRAYHEELSLESMAKIVHLNKCYFCDLFKRQTGKTFSRFLNEVRIEKSKYLLEHTKYSILEISLSVGYNNPNYFIKTFKALTGTTPLKYRQSLTKSHYYHHTSHSQLSTGTG